MITAPHQVICMSIHFSGLDPAGPLFESQDRRARLDSMDAQFVDVIHSNGENLILGGLGAWQPMGHVDFYPNGGRMQKGCTNLFVGAVSDMIWCKYSATFQKFEVKKYTKAVPKVTTLNSKHK